MLKICCLKCGKNKEFTSAAAAWLAGWQPITLDQYTCDMCSQLEYSDISEFDIESDIKRSYKPSDKIKKSIT